MAKNNRWAAMLKPTKELFITIIFLIFSIVLFLFNIQPVQPTYNIPSHLSMNIQEPTNINFDRDTNTLHLGSMTLKQKISQMVVAYGMTENRDFIQRMLIGGIYFVSKPTKQDFIDEIAHFQQGAVIPLFVTADLEGCWNPFLKFYKSPTLRQIKTEQEAYELGHEHGRILNETGFNMNYAPVVDLEDYIWKCRNFIGTPEEIAGRSISYIRGLEESGIIATPKHYPGKTLIIKDPHKHIAYASIEEEDLIPFRRVIEENVPAIMVSHLIVNESVDSESKPAVVSEGLIRNLRKDFDGLIVTDEIRMLGLMDYYEDIDQMYIDLFKADNDVILNFDNHPETLYNMISVVEEAVKRGDINEERIDRSVVRILEAKGINVV